MVDLAFYEEHTRLIDRDEINIVHWCIQMKTAALVSEELILFLNTKGKIDLGDPQALSAYNRAFANVIAGLNITVPPGHLIPTICLRQAYLVTLLDGILNKGDRIVEVGTGASAIIAQLAAKLHQLDVVATEIDDSSFQSATDNIMRNGLLKKINLVRSKGGILKGVIEQYGEFDALLSYPPMYPEDDRIRYTNSQMSGFLGTEFEMIGGGNIGFDFIKKMIVEANVLKIRVISIMLIFPAHVEMAHELLTKQNRQVYVTTLLAGTRKRYIIVGLLAENN